MASYAQQAGAPGDVKIKAVSRDVSKLVAVPKILLRPKPHISPSSTARQIPESGYSKDPLLNVGPDDRSSEKSHMYSEDRESEGNEQVKWEYDVYAAPFIPSVLRAINLEQSFIIETKSRYHIDYKLYAHKYFGINFVPERPVISSDVDTVHFTLPEKEVTEKSYLQYFTALSRIEIAAKKQENEAHSLYNVPLHHIHTTEGEFWALSIPGLREDNPFIEMGDMLQIRELFVDAVGNLTLLPVYSPEQQLTFGTPSITYKHWTGTQYNSSVHSVHRGRETVYLNVQNFNQNCGPKTVLKSANIVFPLNYRMLESQRRALLNVNSQLRKAICPLHQKGWSTRNESLVQFEEEKEDPERPVDRRVCTQHNDWSRRMLFPSEEDGQLQTGLRNIPHGKFFDSAINFEQAHAINAVCTNEYGTLPYLISGPPGTGKTKTLVEIAMQLLNTTENANLLICAPSEPAADTLALRLKEYLNTRELFRLIRPGRADNEVPKELIQYCYVENDMFYLPPLKTLMSFNVVVTSCRDAAILVDAYLTNGDLWSIEQGIFSTLHPREMTPQPSLHWDALFIDEAAQATEIDILPAISVVCPPSEYPTNQAQPRFVMAGDEYQLGPRTASRDPRFSTSLFARLFDRPLYSDHPLSRSKIKPSSGPPVLKRSMLPIICPPFTLLIRNYRSHPAILSVPSSLFYNDTLIPEASMQPSSLQQSSFWQGRKWPVLFMPHNQPDEIERDGGGWYNLSEARLACSIAQQLVDESHVLQQDICIMSPFAAQVKTLRSMLRSTAYGNRNGLWEVNIGPLEAFQGLEKRVVIVCTTRTRERFLAMDEKRGLGIVHQRRKMNVALTRAKEALFVIGSPTLLGKDKHWREWMAFCWRNGLVELRRGMWNGEEAKFGKEKLGVLERALLAKENHEMSKNKALGAGADSHDEKAQYEAWVESLRETLEEEADEQNEDVEEGDELDNGINGSDGEGENW